MNTNTTNREQAMNLDTFTQAYVECALWSSTDNADDSGGEPLDANYGVDDIAPEALSGMIEDCRQFQDDNRDTWDTYWTDEQAGHDFWLTRNGHGAGFWDRYSGEQEGTRIGSKLTDAARAWGSSDLYVGDDGKIYVL